MRKEALKALLGVMKKKQGMGSLGKLKAVKVVAKDDESLKKGLETAKEVISPKPGSDLEGISEIIKKHTGKTSPDVVGDESVTEDPDEKELEALEKRRAELMKKLGKK